MLLRVCNALYCDRIVLLRGDFIVNGREPMATIFAAFLARFEKILATGRHGAAIEADEDAYIKRNVRLTRHEPPDRTHSQVSCDVCGSVLSRCCPSSTENAICKGLRIQAGGNN